MADNMAFAARRACLRPGILFLVAGFVAFGAFHLAARHGLATRSRLGAFEFGGHPLLVGDDPYIFYDDDFDDEEADDDADYF